METDFDEFGAGDGAAFVDWIARNPNGYVLNLDSPTGPFGMLHLGRCSHWAGPTPSYRDEASRKICTDTEFMMRRWITEHLPNGAHPARCSDCL